MYGENYTRNEWRRCKNTLETSGEDVKIHSKRVEKIVGLQTQPFGARVTAGKSGLLILKKIPVETTLETSVLFKFSTRFECSLCQVDRSILLSRKDQDAGHLPLGHLKMVSEVQYDCKFP